MVESSRRPRGVPGAGGLKLPPIGALTGVGLGLAAAGLTAAAGVAADRLSRERRVSVALDEELAVRQFTLDADRQLSVPVAHAVELHVEIDEPRPQDSSGWADTPKVPPADGVTGDPRGPVDSDAAAGNAPAAPDDTHGSGPGSSTAPGGLGTAPPSVTVVFSHGYCLSSLSWYFQRRTMREAGHRVVVWDQRGHGRSGTGPAEGYRIDGLGDDLAAVIDAAAPTGPLVLVGHSMGGMTMMALALSRSDILERVVGAAFVATSPGNLSEVTYGLGPVAGRLIHKYGAGATALLARRQHVVDGTVRVGRDLMDYVVDLGSFASPVPLSVARLTTQMIFGTRMEVISAFFPGFAEHDKREALERFDGIETLVISGDRDRLTPASHSEEIVRMLPGAEHVLVSDAGHVIMLEHPRLLDRHLLELVERANRSSVARARGASPAGTSPRVRTVRRQVVDVEHRLAAERARRRRRLW